MQDFLTQAEQRDVAAYWRIYAAHREPLQRELIEAAGRIPRFGHVLESLAGEDLSRLSAKGFELQRDAALEGLWEPYLEHLRELGSAFAAQGVELDDWLELMRLHRRLMIPRIQEDEGHDIHAFGAAISGMQHLLDIATTAISRNYLLAKEAQVRDYALQYRTLFAAAPVSMWEEDLTSAAAAVEAMRAEGEHPADALPDDPGALADVVGRIEIQQANQTSADLFEARDPDELRARRADVLLPESLEAYRRLLAALLRGEPKIETETTVATLGGRRIHVLFSARFRRGECGTTSIVSLIDLTERKEAAEELARSNAELEQFAYVASHDLQEPLRKLVAFSRLLPEDLGADLSEAAAKDLDFITDAAQRMQQLIDDLLALSRVRSERMRTQRVSLDRCLDDAIEALSLLVEEVGANVRREALPEVEGDPTLLTQLFQNLLANALKFRGENPPEVAVTAEPDVDGWIVRVCDNGIGLRPDYAGQIFQAFRRLHKRRAYPGSGIGLAICRKAVELHGGRIWVHSEGEGRGSCFSFTLGPRLEGAL